MNVQTPRMVTGLMVGTLWAASLSYSATPLQKPSGSIAGLVVDHSGVPQMGAVVQLFDRHERLLGKALTNADGSFGFATLLPDTYSLRVNLATFFPALKKSIIVQPGMQSLLNVNMASVFSSVELVYSGPPKVMSEEWKWVLRSASATRPILRALPHDTVARRKEAAAVFSQTRGLVRVSGGDDGRVSFLGSEPDLGTAFALATSFMGANQLHVAGNVGYSSATGAPSAGFRTSFSRDAEGAMIAPEVKLTMRQLYLPGRIGSAMFTGQQNGPALRTLSVTTMNHAQISDDLSMEYGFSLESVSFLDRLNYFSPFARLSYDGGSNGTFRFSYYSGAPPAELVGAAGEVDPSLQQDVAALSMFPRVSLRDNRPRVQRAESYEIGYEKKVGSRTVALSAYTDTVKNAAITTFSDAGLEPTPDLLPDVFSNSYVWNAGTYEANGFMAAVTQALGPDFDVTMAYGNGTGLTAESALAAVSLADMRDLLRSRRMHRVTAKVAGVIPETGTRFASSYEWASAAAVTPAHMFLTQALHEGLGWNLRVQQPLPSFLGWAGRLEATAELRNLLAQGYVPLPAGLRRLYLVQAPRSFRGGLSFIF